MIDFGNQTWMVTDILYNRNKIMGRKRSKSSLMEMGYFDEYVEKLLCLQRNGSTRVFGVAFGSVGFVRPLAHCPVTIDY